MRKLFQAMRTRCEAFLDQRDDLVLVARAGPSEYVALTSILDSLSKEDDRPEVFWLFAESFESKPAYAEAIARAFQSRLELVNAKLVKEGEPPLAPVPAEALDAGLDPVVRLRTLMTFARGLIPEPESSHLIWCLLPGEIADPAGFATLVIELLRHELPVPWCRHMRVVVREPQEPAMLHQHAQSLFRAQWYQPDLSTAAVERSLEDEAGDEQLPLPQRMQALFVLAGMDIAQRRFTEGIEKYGLLSKYYNATGEKTLCALSLNGLGEIADRSGNPELARKHFEMALTPATEAEDLPPLLNVTLNLANLHRNQKRWAEALEHYQAVSALAKACCNAPLQIRSLEQMGFCRYKLGDAKGAWEDWTAGKTLAKGVESEGEELACLERLRGLFAELGMKAQRKEADHEIAELEKRGVRAYPA